MPPELLVAVFPLDRFAGEPLFLGNALEVPIAVRVQAVIGHEHRLDDRAMLPRRDHREVFDIEIDRHGHQVGILLALHHLLGCDLPDLGDMQLCRVGSQDERRALPLPVRLLESFYGVAAAVDWVLHPGPVLPGVDVDAHKGLSCIERLQIEYEASLVECGMIAGRRPSWLSLLLAACFPIRTVRQIGADLANRVLDDGAPIGKGHAWKALRKVPTSPGRGMGCRYHRGRLGPGQEGMGGNEAFAPFQMLLAVIGNPLAELVCMREKKVDVESACRSEHRCRGIQGGAFLGIGTSLFSLAQIKQHFGSSADLSHLALPLSRTKVLHACSIRSMAACVKGVGTSASQFKTCINLPNTPPPMTRLQNWHSA